MGCLGLIYFYTYTFIYLLNTFIITFNYKSTNSLSKRKEKCSRTQSWLGCVEALAEAAQLIEKDGSFHKESALLFVSIASQADNQFEGH